MRHYDAIDRDLVRIDGVLAERSRRGAGDGVYEESWMNGVDFVFEPLNAAADGRPWELVRCHPRGSYRFPTDYPRAVKVTGRFGWPAVPPAIVEATTILASKLLRRAREAPFGIVSFGVDGGAARIARTDPDVAFLVRPFIRGGMGFA